MIPNKLGSFGESVAELVHVKHPFVGVGYINIGAQR